MIHSETTPTLFYAINVYGYRDDVVSIPTFFKVMRPLSFTLLVLIVSSILSDVVGQSITVTGFVNDSSSKEPLSDVSVYVQGTSRGTQTNAYGFFSLTLDNKSVHTLRFSHVAYAGKTVVFSTTKAESKRVNVLLAQTAQTLSEVQVYEESNSEAQRTQMSVIRMTSEQIKQMPMLLGEKDLLKALQLLPGVQQGTEGSSLFYVRGGGADQNLLLLDNATVYNANHLFGFFSTFNADAIKHVALYKGSFPARYGGRLSSVVDIQLKEGNRQKLHGEGGIGLLSSRLTLEGPIIKNKASFLLAARRTYLDGILRLVQPKDSRQSYWFYDINAKLNWTIDKRSTLYASIYTGKDQLSISEFITRSRSTIQYRNGINWGNVTASLRWNYVVSPKIFVNTTVTNSIYTFELTDFFERIRSSTTYQTDLRFGSGVRDNTIKVDVDYYPNLRNTVRFGGGYTLYRFIPRQLENTLIDNDIRKSNIVGGTTVRNREGYVYAESDYEINDQISLQTGLRLAYFRTDGATQWRPEPRIGVAYRVKQGFSLKGGYARTNQFLHQLSNTGVGLPTDLWVPATRLIKPQQADQLSVGLVKNLGRAYAFTTEVYYKWMRALVNYAPGASFLTIGEDVTATPDDWQEAIINGKGWAYGWELLAEKKIGRLTGWAGYTLGWSIRQFDQINEGKPFYARQDRRHELKIVSAYSLRPSVKLSATWQYLTGTALTVPQGFYINQHIPIGKPTVTATYGQYNGFRTPAYHRLDVGVQFIRKKRWGERTWEISAFNAYNRKNVNFYTLQRQADLATRQNYYALSSRWLLPVLPSVSYQFTF